MTIKNGTAGADTLIGTSLADQLFGKGGNDILKGLAGPDLLDGGEGRDTADYSGSAAVVAVNLSDGSTGFGGDAAGDTYVSIENVTGSSFNDTLDGSSGANQLAGGLGDDVLLSRGGNDTLIGGGGNDLFQGSAAADVIAGGGGRDTLSFTNSVLGVNVNLSTGQAGGNAAGDTISGIENLTGSAGKDILAGTASANTLGGFKGNDGLFGFAGNDALFGGEGADTMTGGDGADTFVFVFPEDSPTGFLARDVIQDFRHAQGDIINLRSIDANTQAGGDEAFEFLGKDATIDAPGQISYSFEGNTTVVQINTAGGFGPPEMEIQLQGNVDLVASDFIL